MDMEIAVSHFVPEDDFRMMKEVYPTGQYKYGPDNPSIEWFTVVIEGDSGKVELTWFKDL